MTDSRSQPKQPGVKLDNAKYLEVIEDRINSDNEKKNELYLKRRQEVIDRYGMEECSELTEDLKIQSLLVIPSTISEFNRLYSKAPNREKQNLKGNRFNKFYLYSTILSHELNNTFCALTDDEFCQVLKIEDNTKVKKYILELLEEGYIRYFSNSGDYRDYLEKITLTRIKNCVDKKVNNNFSKVVVELQEIIDEYNECSVYSSSTGRYLVCNFEKIPINGILKIPMIPGFISKMNVYEYLVFAIILSKSYPNIEIILKNKDYATMLGCSVREIEKSISSLKQNGYINISYKDSSQKHRLSISLNQVKVEQMITSLRNTK